jgi:tetratricopeptide (TPR) repeat protein
MKDLSDTSKLASKSFKRANAFFRTSRKSGNEGIEIGRRFLEESLAVDPERPEPRICLGCYYSLGVRNYDKAREQFRKVLMLGGLDEERRSEALINLGLALKIELKYEEALACFREVVKSGVIKRHPRFYRCLIFLAITYAKIGKYEQSVLAFQRTVKEFPRKIREIRKELWDMRTFQNVVQSEPLFRRDLEKRIPVLFAS